MSTAATTVVPGVGEQPDHAFAQQQQVFGDHDAHGNSARRTVGPPGGLVTVSVAVEGFDAAAEPVEAGSGRVGAAAAVVGDGDGDRRRRWSCAVLTTQAVAPACLAALVRPSATTKYAADSTAAGYRAAGSPWIVDGERAVAGERGEGGVQSPVAEDRRVDAADQAAQFGEGVVELPPREVDVGGGGRCCPPRLLPLLTPCRVLAPAARADGAAGGGPPQGRGVFGRPGRGSCRPRRCGPGRRRAGRVRSAAVRRPGRRRPGGGSR